MTASDLGDDRSVELDFGKAEEARPRGYFASRRSSDGLAVVCVADPRQLPIATIW